MNPIREISGNKVPIYTWQSGSTSGVTFLFGPEHLGGNGDLAKKIEKITTVDENERYEEGQKVIAILSVQYAQARMLNICRYITGLRENC